MRRVVCALFLFGLIGLPKAVSAQVVVDQTSIASFDTVTATQKSAASTLRLLMVDRSVGAIINDGLTCLTTTYDSAKSACKRYLHVVPAYNNIPERWNGSWPRQQWVFFGWPGTGIAPELACGRSANTWNEKLSCFGAYVAAQRSAYDVVLLMPSYLDAPVASSYVDQALALRTQYPNLVVALATSSLARGPIAGLSTFNTSVRNLAASHGFPLIDIAKIEQYDQTGRAWFDNRDGVAYNSGSCSENWPDDRISEPAIAPQYVRECEGGHPGNPDVGKIRIAKAIWVLMVRIAELRP